jgi:heparanase
MRLERQDPITKSILGGCAFVLGLGVAACTADKRQTETPASSALPVSPATMARVGSVDDRYQSYNVEMLEVTGGVSD